MATRCPVPDHTHRVLVFGSSWQPANPCIGAGLPPLDTRDGENKSTCQTVPDLIPPSWNRGRQNAQSASSQPAEQTENQESKVKTRNPYRRPAASNCRAPRTPTQAGRYTRGQADRSRNPAMSPTLYEKAPCARQPRAYHQPQHPSHRQPQQLSALKHPHHCSSKLHLHTLTSALPYTRIFLLAQRAQLLQRLTSSSCITIYHFSPLLALRSAPTPPLRIHPPLPSPLISLLPPSLTPLHLSLLCGSGSIAGASRCLQNQVGQSLSAGPFCAASHEPNTVMASPPVRPSLHQSRARSAAVPPSPRDVGSASAMTTRRIPASIGPADRAECALVLCRAPGSLSPSRRRPGRPPPRWPCLGASPTLPLVETLADDLAICVDHDTAHGRIRACRAKACR